MKPATKFNFAKTYAELQKIVAWFNGPEVDLEEGVKKLETGANLAKELKQYLQTVENKIKELKSKT